MGGKDKFEKKVDAMEMEMLNPSNDDDHSTEKKHLKDFFLKILYHVKHRVNKAMMLVKIYYRVYPKIVVGVAVVLAMVLIKLLFFRHRGQTVYVLPHLVNHFGDVQSYYDLQIGKIDHWCLHGDDDSCRCQDPTMATGRANPFWEAVHVENKAKALHPPPNLDVVFLGDQFVQAWTGQFLTRPISGGAEVQASFNRTFQRAHGGLVDGIVMGIAGDTASRLLWRIQNGEMPSTLNPKVWWLHIGANDLAVSECSEEAVMIGILRLADEIKDRHPDSVVVVQGILPRSANADGHVRTVGNMTAPKTVLNHHKKEYVRTTEYPLWPSIQLVNHEVAKFCAKHKHLLYFDASDIFFGSIGNEHFQATDRVIIKELFRKDQATPSTKGFEILAKVIGREVVRIVYNHDESNHKVTVGEERRR